MAQRMAEQQSAQGWKFTSEYVCTTCVDDYALQDAIRRAESGDETCDFCGRFPAAELDVLLDVFVRGLKNEYGNADDEGVFWDGQEGGYQWGETWDTWDLVGDFEHVLVGEGLVDAVRRAMEDTTWVERNFAHPRRDEALSASWERFCEAVQYETRYVFWLRNDEDLEEARQTGEVPASQILDELGGLIERFELIRDLPAGYRLWRAQTHDKFAIAQTAKRLGTAPRDKATQANRMSPAGIPMFYGAEDAVTVVREVAVRTNDEWVTAGIFETSVECSVVDFTRLPPIPSLFDPEWGVQRRPLRFLHQFVDQLSKPARPEYEQIDYVPTQIVTEYLLRIFSKSQPLVGMLYPSVLTGEACAVLDVPNDACVEQVAGWMDNSRFCLGLAHETPETRRIGPADRR